jgi:hypothetical protein
MLNKVEHKTRNVSFIEVRELAEVLRTAIAELDATASRAGSWPQSSGDGAASKTAT